MKPLIHFVHGKESGPWGTKIRHLADIAREMGYDVESLDYSSTFDPETRVEMLANSCHTRPAQYLVGSSMGGWVAMTASALDAMEMHSKSCTAGTTASFPSKTSPGSV